MEYYLAINNEITSFVATWMDIKIIILSEVSERKTYMVSVLCGILDKRIQINLITEEKQTHRL